MEIHLIRVYNKFNKSNRTTTTLTTTKGRRTNVTVKSLKPYKGFEIEKSYEEKADGTIKKDTIIYTAYPVDSYGVFDAAKTLSALKKEIDTYTK